MKNITKIATVVAVATLAVATSAGAAQTVSKEKNGVTLTGSIVVVNGGAQPSAYATSTTSQAVGNIVASLHTYYGDGRINFGANDANSNSTYVQTETKTLDSTAGHFGGYHQFTDKNGGFVATTTNVYF